MSSGTFLRSRYAATWDTGAIHPIRVQPETIAMALTSNTTTTNAPPSGAINNPISAMVSRPLRGKGLRPRKVTLQLTGTAPTGYANGSVVSLPVLNTTLFAALTNGVSVNYLGTTWEVISTDPEYAD